MNSRSTMNDFSTDWMKIQNFMSVKNKRDLSINDVMHIDSF